MPSQFHDRLDLKLDTLQYTEAVCGSLNAQTGQPEYCDFQCPTLTPQQQPQAVPAQQADPTEVIQP